MSDCKTYQESPAGCTPATYLVYVQKPLTDPTPRTAYVQRTCGTLDGWGYAIVGTEHVPNFRITIDQDGLVLMEGYTLADQVKVPQGVQRGSTALDPVYVVNERATQMVTSTGVDCAGNPMPVNGLLGELQTVVQAPGTAFNVRICTPTDRELVHLCDPTNNHKITVQYDVTQTPPSLLSAWDLSANSPYTGLVSSLEECVSERLDYGSPVAYCSGGLDYTRTDVYNALTMTLVGSIWQDASGAVVAAPSAPVIGACKVVGLEFTITGVNCAGVAVPVLGTEGQQVLAVPHPTAVQPTRDCNSNAQLAAIAAIAASVAPLAFGGRQSILQGWVLPFGGSVKVPAFISVLHSSDNNPNNTLCTIYYDQSGNLTSLGGFSPLSAFGVFGVDWGLGPVPAVPPAPNVPRALGIGNGTVGGDTLTSVPVASVKSIALHVTNAAVKYSVDGGTTFITIAAGNTRTWAAQPGTTLDVSNMRFQGTSAVAMCDIVYEV